VYVEQRGGVYGILWPCCQHIHGIIMDPIGFILGSFHLDTGLLCSPENIIQGNHKSILEFINPWIWVTIYYTRHNFLDYGLSHFLPLFIWNLLQNLYYIYLLFFNSLFWYVKWIGALISRQMPWILIICCKGIEQYGNASCYKRIEKGSSSRAVTRRL